MQSAQVDQHVDERVLVRDGLAIAQPRPLDAQRLGLGVDALGGGARAGAAFVDLLVDRALAVDRMAPLKERGKDPKGFRELRWDSK